MSNLPKTSKKTFIESLISLAALLLATISSIEDCEGVACLGLIMAFIPIFIWIIYLIILTIKDFLKKREDRILEALILGSCFLFLFSARLLQSDSIGTVVIGCIVGLFIPIAILLLAIKNRISGNELEAKTENSGSYLFGVIFSIIGVILGYFLAMQFDFFAILLFVGPVLGWNLGYGIGKKKENHEIKNEVDNYLKWFLIISIIISLLIVLVIIFRLPNILKSINS